MVAGECPVSGSRRQRCPVPLRVCKNRCCTPCHLLQSSHGRIHARQRASSDLPGGQGRGQSCCTQNCWSRLQRFSAPSKSCCTPVPTALCCWLNACASAAVLLRLEQPRAACRAARRPGRPGESPASCRACCFPARRASAASRAGHTTTTTEQHAARATEALEGNMFELLPRQLGVKHAYACHRHHRGICSPLHLRFPLPPPV